MADVNFSMGDILATVLRDEGSISKCYNNFHNYSINNQFLAYWQMSVRGIDISPINSFGKWKRNFDRSVKKGEKAIYLWQPFEITVTDTDEVTGKAVTTKKLIFKYLPKWFALSQTEGKEFKPEVATVGDFNFDKVIKKYGIKVVPFNDIDGNCQGFARTVKKELAINPVAEHGEMTMLHEIAHILLKHGSEENKKMSVQLCELEAECVAYIVGTILKLPEVQLSNSRGYVQNWFKSDAIPDKNASRIMTIANDILKAGLGK